EEMHRPRPVLDELVAAGRTGQASGAGFYTYADAGSAEVVADDKTPAGASDDENLREISSVGVVGSGTMATGIIQVFAQSGYPVTYIARSQDKVDGVRAAIEKSLAKAESAARR